MALLSSVGSWPAKCHIFCPKIYLCMTKKHQKFVFCRFFFKFFGQQVLESSHEEEILYGYFFITGNLNAKFQAIIRETECFLA